MVIFDRGLLWTAGLYRLRGGKMADVLKILLGDAVERYGDFLKVDVGKVYENPVIPLDGVTYHDTPFGSSLGKEILSDETSTESLRVGMSALFVRSEKPVVIEEENGAAQKKATESFWDMGYLQDSVSDPAAPKSDISSDHETKVSFFGARRFSQPYVSDVSKLYATDSIGVTLDGDIFAQAALTNVCQGEQWNLSATTQVSYADDLAQLDVALGAETPFKTGEISGVFNTEIRGAANPENQKISALAQARFSGDHEAGQWDLSAGAQVSCLNDLMQLDMKLEAESPFEIGHVSGVFNGEVQALLNAENKQVTAFAGVDVRFDEDVDGWKSWFSAAFKTALSYDTKEKGIEAACTVGAYVDVPFSFIRRFGVERFGIEASNKGEYAAVFKQGF